MAPWTLDHAPLSFAVFCRDGRSQQDGFRWDGIVHEIFDILRFIAKREPTTIMDVHEAVEAYLAPIIWSLEKEEWARMTSAQRIRFCREVLKWLQTKTVGER